MALRSLLQSAGPRGSTAVHGCSRMATFDEVFPAAVQELEDRGLLLNMHLVGLVGGDQQLLSTVREALIREGLAHDRYGVGLAKSSNFDTQRATYRVQPSPPAASTNTTDEIVFAGVSQSDADWWLMSCGATTGPFSLDILIQMRRLGEVSDIDMIREGPKGMWLIPKNVAELADITPARRPSQKAKTRSTETALELGRAATEPVFSQSQEMMPPHASRQNAVLRTPRIPSAVQSHAPDKDMIEYYLWDAGHSVGPVSIQELQARLESGSLEAEDFVQVGKDGDWQPVSLAMGVPRPPLQIPQVALNALQGGQTDPALAAPTSTIWRTSTPQAAIPVVKQSNPKSSKTVAKQNEEPTESPLVRAWLKASRLVGGQSRLWVLITATACSVAMIIWLRQPPSASVIYQELITTHKRTSDARRLQPGSNKPVKVASEELQRVVAIRDGLAKRASANQPAIQELLWACEYGLVPIMEQPYGSPDFERVFADHMGRAERLIDPSSSPSAKRPATGRSKVLPK